MHMWIDVYWFLFQFIIYCYLLFSLWSKLIRIVEVVNEKNMRLKLVSQISGVAVIFIYRGTQVIVYPVGCCEVHFVWIRLRFFF